MGETVETVTDFIFLGSKITVDGDCSHEIKRCLLLGRKTMTNQDSLFKSRDITLLTKVWIVKDMVFSGMMYGCESWVIKIYEHWRIDAFEVWYWRKLLIVPWTARGSNQWILKEISPEYSSEGLLLKLKLQYFGHLMWRTDSLEKTLMLGKIEGRRRRDDRGWECCMPSLTQWTSVWASSGVCEAWCAAVHGVAKSCTWLSDWTELNWTCASRWGRMCSLGICQHLFWWAYSTSSYSSSQSFEIWKYPAFPCGSAGKESDHSAGDLGSIPGFGRSPEEGEGYPLTVFWPREFHRLYSP